MDRINARLPEELARHVARMVGPYFETPSEYIRDLIRRDMEVRGEDHIRADILSGLEDYNQGRYFKGSGDFKEDLRIYRERKHKGWT